MDRNAFAALAKQVALHVNEVVAPLVARITALEARPTEKGDRGEPGPAGDRGPPGDKGEPGRDGRDAADLALLQNHIDGQIATGISGIVKTFSVVSPDNGRTLHAKLGDTMHEIKTAIPLDAGVWTQREYAVGDSVSHGGSLFIAQTTTTAKPGQSDDWRLAVKRGNDGRDHRGDDTRPPDKPVRFK